MRELSAAALGGKRGRNGDFRLWWAIAVTVGAGLVAWGATTTTVFDHGRRLDRLEQHGDERLALDQQILQRLAVIETELRGLHEGILGRRLPPPDSGGRP